MPDFVTRFIGFRNGYDSYQPDLDSYLNKEMGRLGRITEEERQGIKSGFIEAMKTAFEIFGNDAFRKRYDLKAQRNPINKALFETWSVNLASLYDHNINILVTNKQKVREKFINLMNTDKDFDKSITSATGDLKAVKKRFSTIAALIKEVVNDNRN